MGSRTIIKTAGLTKKYGRLEVLKSLDLEVPEYAIFGFLGPNGAGKTTTMKVLLGEEVQLVGPLLTTPALILLFGLLAVSCFRREEF